MATSRENFLADMIEHEDSDVLRDLTLLKLVKECTPPEKKDSGGPTDDDAYGRMFNEVVHRTHELMDSNEEDQRQIDYDTYVLNRDLKLLKMLKECTLPEEKNAGAPTEYRRMFKDALQRTQQLLDTSDCLIDDDIALLIRDLDFLTMLKDCIPPEKKDAELPSGDDAYGRMLNDVLQWTQQMMKSNKCLVDDDIAVLLRDLDLVKMLNKCTPPEKDDTGLPTQYRQMFKEALQRTEQLMELNIDLGSTENDASQLIRDLELLTLIKQCEYAPPHQKDTGVLRSSSNKKVRAGTHQQGKKHGKKRGTKK